eukprot:650061-Prorocentrum_minimum.AAC.1
MRVPKQESITVTTGDFRDTLPGVLAAHDPKKVAVVACHACSHLTDEILASCQRAQVDFAVRSCFRFIPPS